MAAQRSDLPMSISPLSKRRRQLRTSQDTQGFSERRPVEDLFDHLDERQIVRATASHADEDGMADHVEDGALEFQLEPGRIQRNNER